MIVRLPESIQVQGRPSFYLSWVKLVVDRDFSSLHAGVSATIGREFFMSAKSLRELGSGEQWHLPRSAVGATRRTLAVRGNFAIQRLGALFRWGLRRDPPKRPERGAGGPWRVRRANGRAIAFNETHRFRILEIISRLVCFEPSCEGELGMLCE